MTEESSENAYAVWSPEFSVGVDKVDEQHKKLFAMINTLHTAAIANDSTVDIERIIEEMASYVSYHFETEKSLLHHLPEFEAHEREHWDFTKKTLQFASEYHQQPRKELAHTILDFLIRWLKGHIKAIDIEQFSLSNR